MGSKGLSQSSCMYVTSIANLRNQPERLRTLDRTDDHHFGSNQGREIHCFLTSQAKVHHDRLCELEKNFVPGFLVITAEQLARNPVGSVRPSIDISSNLESIEDAINRRLRHANRPGNQCEIYPRGFAPQYFQDIQRLVKHSNLSGTLGRRIHD